ncbi:MAG: dsDNA nuclease domain-containing protein, partial [Polaromonas sp.]
KTNMDYVVLVEHHEDVVLIKPAQVADATSAKFFFYQVKNISGKAWTAKNLISRTKAKATLKNSVLGKLVQGTHGQPFSAQLDSILIVATCGFSLPQIKPDQQYQELGHADLTPQVQQQLRDAMETELGHPVDLTRLRLLKPKLGADYVAGVVLAIVDLVAAKMPGALSNPRYIYQNLIDELHRRGVIQYDYQSWENLLQEKALSGAE